MLQQKRRLSSTRDKGRLRRCDTFRFEWHTSIGYHGEERRKKGRRGKWRRGGKKRKKEQDEMRDTMTMCVSIFREGEGRGTQPNQQQRTLKAVGNDILPLRFEKERKDGFTGTVISVLSRVCVWRLCARPTELPGRAFALLQ